MRYSSGLRFRAAALLIVFVVSGALWAHWLPFDYSYANPQVVGNPSDIRYEGRGGLILPPSVSSEDRIRVAGCRDCEWKMTPACLPGPDNYCDAVIRSCPGLIDHVRTWFRPANGDWVETGLICLTTYRIATVADIDRFILESFHQHVPPLEPQCWPAQKVIVQLPYVCESGQKPHSHMWTHTVAGHNIEVSATPAWTWNFHGSHFSTTKSGGPFPNLSVSHTFTKHGNKSLQVETRWQGSFTVVGLGTFPIEEQLSQTRSWTVPVGEARARLIAPRLTTPG